MYILKNSTTNEIICIAGINAFEGNSYDNYIIEETEEAIVEHTDGKKYKVSEIPAPTEEELQAHYTNLIQSYLDSEAQKLRL